MSAVAKSTIGQIANFRRALARAEMPEDVIKIGAGIAGIEEMMRRSGLYRTDAIRPVRELFLDSRWVLGRLLKKIMRAKAGRPKRNTGRAAHNFKDELKRIGLEPKRASEAQRISTLPEDEKAKAYEDATRQDVLPTIEMLIDIARPYWYQESREQKHKNIAEDAQGKMQLGSLGPFPLIYADPPWKFEIYSPRGLERTPDQHYPTMTDQEIIDFSIDGKTVPEIAAKDAALLLWCTSSNIKRALAVMEAWGFDYSAHAIWDKMRSGLGLVFRNQHEVLLYGKRGKMPGPQYQPPSVFRYRRGKHSAKPPEIRREIEKMYPDFDEQTRIEIFARGATQGWTVYGNEAYSRAAAE